MATALATGRLEAAPTRSIADRSDLIRTLEEACELEHALLVQYLFAAFSIRTRPEAGGPDAAEAEFGRRWKRTLLLVAHDEMMHLGLAANVLSAVGGRAWLRRSALPAPQRYFHHHGDHYVLATLTRLTGEAVERFVRFEAPEPH